MVQCLVEIVHLCQDTETRNDGKDVGGGLSKLIVAPQGKFHGNAKGLDGHDGDGANGRADRDVNERVSLSVHRCYPVDHDG